MKPVLLMGMGGVCLSILTAALLGAVLRMPFGDAAVLVMAVWAIISFLCRKPRIGRSERISRSERIVEERP